MHFAVLGTDPDLLALMAAALSEGHDLVWLGDVRPEDESALRRRTSLRVAPTAEWETLLDHATCDAVLVGRGSAGEDLRVEQLKRLVADAVPLLVVHPAGPPLLAYYELDMVRRETGAIVRHYNPLVGHPILAELAQWVRGGHESIGTVHQVTCSRRVRNAARETVLDGLARDVELLAAIAGDIRRVNAIGPQVLARELSAPVATSYASLQVQMTTAGPATLRWSVVPGGSAAGQIELALIGEHGTIAVEQISDFGLRIDFGELSRAADSSDQSEIEFDAPTAAIHGLVDAIAQSPDARGQNDADSRSTWASATRAMEAVDAVELSLQKGRTIEVYQQQLTEQLAFRGTMAALGCGLLLVGTLVMLIAAIAGGADWILQRPVMRSWPLIVLAVLAFFLFLQIVPWLASRQRARRMRDDADNFE